MKITGYKESSAEFSSDGIYRYSLARAWAPGGPRAVVVGYNPSTADALTDDQTIRRLRQLLAVAGFNGFVIVNLYAFRSTDPKVLGRGLVDPVGPDNDRTIREEIRCASELVIAWGGIGRDHVAAGPRPWLPPDAPRRRRDFVLSLAAEESQSTVCFGFTKDGAPRHPSRLPRTAKLEAFR